MSADTVVIIVVWGAFGLYMGVRYLRQRREYRRQFQQGREEGRAMAEKWLAEGMTLEELHGVIIAAEVDLALRHSRTGRRLLRHERIPPLKWPE